jgi:NADH:ubiquinone oxidoreductase subunit E
MGKDKKTEKVIYFCDGKKCCRYNDEVKECFKDLVKESGLKKTVAIEKMKCQGMCKQAPVICIHKKECIGKVTKKDAKKLFEKHIA